mgnify:CR=1 FL=1
MTQKIRTILAYSKLFLLIVMIPIIVIYGIIGASLETAVERWKISHGR